MFFHVWIHATVTAPSFAPDVDSFYIFFISNGFLLASLLLIIVFVKQVSRYAEKSAFLILVALFSSVGTLLLGVDYLLGGTLGGFAIAGTIITACGTGGLLALWGEGYARFDSARTQIVVTFAAMIGSFFLYLFTSALPSPISLAVTALFPFVSITCLRVVLLPHDKKPARRTQIIPLRANLPVKLLVYIVAFSVPLNFLNMQISSSGNAITQEAWPLVFSYSLLIITAAAIVELVLEKRTITILSFLIVVLATGGLLLYLFSNASSTVLMYTLMYSGYYLFVATFYSYLGMLTLLSTRQPLQIFAIGNCANTLGLIMGSGIGFLVQRLASSWAAIITFVLVYALFFVGLIFLPQARRNLFSSGEHAMQADYAREKHSSIEESVQYQCGNVAKAFALSPREEEILNYLVRGRSIQSIAHEMVLSQNTVKTHVNHIYQKCNVHGREELIMLVENVEIN